MKLIWRYIKRYPKWLLLDAFGALCFVLLNLGLPTILAKMVDEGMLTGETDKLYFWGWIMAVVIILGFLGRIVLIYSSSRLTTNMIQTLRNDMFDKIQEFSHREYEQIGVSSLVTRITSDAFVLMQFADQTLRLGVITPLMMLSSIFMIIITSPSLAWLLALGIPPLGFSIYWIAVRSRPISEKQQTTLDKINQYVRENLTGLRVIRAFAREDYQQERFEEKNDAYANTSQRLFKLMGLAPSLFVHIVIWMIVLIVWFSLSPVEQGTLQVGSLIAFIEYAFHALFSFMLFANLFMMYPKMSVSARRIEEVLNLPISIPMNLDGVTESTTRGYLEFDNVTFSYPGETESPVLQNISFKANPGETVAFIGSTGSGKSSLVQLIPRFYDVTFGRILVDGIDVREYQLKSLRQKIGFIPQKALLFTGTIGENLRYGKPDAHEHELEAASDVAQAREFIERTEGRFQTMLSEGGVNLSGGQKQRLSIARAVVKQPDIYIFDDSFSALDYKTDAILRKRLKEVTQDATVLIVAQRVGSIMNADQIIVLDNGKIVARGTHETLMQTNDIYREIANSQLNSADEHIISQEEGNYE